MVKRWKLGAAAVVAISAVTTPALGSDIEAWVGGTRVGFASSGADLHVNLGVVSSDIVVRIFDTATGSGGAPIHSVGKITVNGSLAAGSELVTILVAHASVTSLPTDITLPVSPGVVDAGLATGGLAISDSGLRDNATLLLAASGTVRGPIEAGRVWRVQAFRDVGALSGGVIEADITSTSPDRDAGPTLPDLSKQSIGVVAASVKYDGKIRRKLRTAASAA